MADAAGMDDAAGTDAALLSYPFPDGWRGNYGERLRPDFAPRLVGFR